MQTTFTFKNFEPSEHLRAYAERRFKKLARFIHKAENVAIAAVLTVDKFRHKIEVQLTGDAMNFSAMEQSPDMYATIDLVLDKLATQLKKHAERTKEKRRDSQRSPQIEVFSYDTKAEDTGPVVVGTDRFVPKPMYDDEAALQLEQGGEAFLVFLNAETHRVNVIYRRKNGGIGLIDPVV